MSLRRAKTILRLLLAGTAISFGPPLHAAIRAWIGGGADAFWSTPANWSPPGPPANGEDLRFGHSDGSINDIQDLVISSLAFWGTTGDSTISGNTLILAHNPSPASPYAIDATGFSGKQISFRCGLKLNHDATCYVGLGVSSGSIRLNLEGPIDLNGFELRLEPLKADGTGEIYVSGQISGNGDVVASSDDDCYVEFNGAGNTFHGILILSAHPTGQIVLNVSPGVVATDTVRVLGLTRTRSGAIAPSEGITYARSHQIGDDATLLIEKGAKLRLNGRSDTVGILSFLNTTNDDLPSGLDTGLGTLTVNGGIIGASATAEFVPYLTGRLNLSGFIPITVNGSGQALDIRAKISGNGFDKRGPGSLRLSGTNDFSGDAVVTEGRLEARTAGALGQAGPAFGTHLNGGELLLQNAAIGAEPLFVNSAASLLTAIGSCSWDGPVTLNADLQVAALDPTLSDARLIFSGGISGNHGLDLLPALLGAGNVRLSGSSGNAFTGPLTVNCQRLELNKPSGVKACAGPLIVGRPGASAPTEVRWLQSYQNAGATLTLFSNGVVNLNGFNEDFGPVTFHGGGVIAGGLVGLTGPVDVEPENATATFSAHVVLPNNVTFAINNPLVNVGLYMNGTISGPGGITKNGPGLMWVDSAGSYSGPVAINGGEFLVSDSTGLGTRTAGTSVAVGGTLSLGSGAGFLGEPLALAGGGSRETNGALRSTFDIFITNNVVLNGPTTIRTDGTNSRIQILGVISGTGPLTKLGSGVFGFRGGTDNTYSGDTFANEGTMRLTKANSIISVPGHLIIGPALVEQGASFTIRGSVTVNRSGVWNLNGLSESFAIVDLQGHPPVTLNGGGDVQTGAGTLTLPPGGDVVVNPGLFIGGNSSISGKVALDPGPHRFIVQNGLSIIRLGVPELDLSAVISQNSSAADIVKEGPGEMRLSGNNSFSGTVTVSAGLLTVAHASALGTTAAGTFVNGNAALALDGGIEVTENLTLDTINAAALVSLGPVTNTWSGNIVLQRTAGISVPDPNGAFTHFGGAGQFDTSAISGPGGFTKSGDGALFITGLTGGNTYTGPTTIHDGLLDALRRPGRSLSSNIVVTGANAILHTGRAASNLFQFPATTVLPTGASVTVQDGALWTMNATNIEMVSCLTGDGRLDLGSGAVLTVSNGTACTFSGVVSGSGSLNKRGPATFQLTADSPAYTGPATVFDGTYKVDGRIGNSPVTVKSGGKLRGGLAVGDVTVESGGIVKPDATGPGRLGGDLYTLSANFQAGSILEATLFGPDLTGGNDHLQVVNAAALNNPTLNAAFAYPPREGDVITLILKSGMLAVSSGAFNGFPQGGVQSIGNFQVRTSYTGGDGNDVTLTVTNLPLQNGGSQLLSGNGGSALVPNDCSQLWLAVTNRGATTLSGIHGKLRSLTPGVLVTRAESDFSNLAPNARGTNATPFQIRTEPNFPCGRGAQLELVLTGSNIPPIAILYTFLGGAGRALACNGSGNYVRVPHTTALNAFPFTVAMWVKTSQSAGTKGLANKYALSSSNGWNVFLRGSRVRAWYFRDSANNVWGGGDGLDGGSITDGQWHHVAFTVANTLGNSGGRLYVDGVLKDSQAWSSGRDPQPGPPTTTQEVRFGNDAGNGIPLDGLLDEITIWRAALSQSQIQTNMHIGLTGAEANLLAYYRCDEASGSIVADSAPLDGNNNGAWAGTPLFAPSDVAPFSVPGGPDCNSGGGACESCIVISGQFTTNTPASGERLYLSGSPSVCFPPKPCPGRDPIVDLIPDLPPVHNAVHNFANDATNELCVTAQLRFDCPQPFGVLGVAAYLGDFNATQPCANYLGDSGGGGELQSFAFHVPAGSNFVVVVTERVTNLVCQTYTLELFGLPCPPPLLDIVKDRVPNKVLLKWSSAYPDFRLQSVNSLAGPGPLGFVNATTPPVLVSGKFAVSNAATAPSQFFRLAR